MRRKAGVCRADAIQSSPASRLFATLPSLLVESSDLPVVYKMDIIRAFTHVELSQ